MIEALNMESAIVIVLIIIIFIIILPLVFPSIVLQPLYSLLPAKWRGETINVSNIFDRLRKSFEGKVSKHILDDDVSFKGRFERHDFTLTFKYLKRYLHTSRWGFRAGDPHAMSLTLYLPQKQRLNITFFDNDPGLVLMQKRVGVSNDFYASFHITSNYPEMARHFLENGMDLSAIKELMAQGWSLPDISKRSITLTTDKISQDLDPMFIRGTLELMISMGRKLVDVGKQYPAK